MVSVPVSLTVDLPDTDLSEPYVFSVLDFGADDTGTNSSYQAFQDAIDAAKAVAKGPGYGAWANARSGTVLIPKGVYTGVGSLDCTGAVGLTIKGQGAWGSAVYADGQSSSLPVFDFTESNYCSIRDLGIFGMDKNGSVPSVTPNCAVLFADSAANAFASNKNSMHEVNIFGSYAGAALSCYRSTNNNFFGCALHNDNINGPAVFVGNVNNQIGVTSGFKALAGSGGAANQNAFYGCEFHGAKTTSANCGPVWVAGGECIKFDGGVMDSNGTGQPFVYFPTSAPVPVFTGVTFYSENGTAPGNIFQSGSGATIDRLTAVGCFKHPVVASLPNTHGLGTFSNPQLGGM